MELMEVSAAAARLGVTTKQVRRLALEGEIDYAARGVVDATSVEQFLAKRNANRARAWSQETAWAAIDLLSEQDASRLGASQLSRLHKRLRSINAEELVALTRNRAARQEFTAHASSLDEIRSAIIDSSQAEQLLGLVQQQDVSGYISETHLGRLVEQFSLIETRRGNVTLRVISESTLINGKNIVIATALDLAESLDMRERNAGLNALATALENFHE